MVEETIECLRQKQKGLVVEWAKILNSDGGDGDAHSSRSRRVSFFLQLAMLIARVGEVADHVIRIVDARHWDGRWFL